MLPRPETFLRIQNVSNQFNLNTQVWRTDRGDKTPTVVPVGSETGDDTILATTDGQTLSNFSFSRNLSGGGYLPLSHRAVKGVKLLI